MYDPLEHTAVLGDLPHHEHHHRTLPGHRPPAPLQGRRHADTVAPDFSEFCFWSSCYCWPLQGHRLSYSSRVHLLTFILPSVVLAIILNIPKASAANMAGREGGIISRSTSR